MAVISSPGEPGEIGKGQRGTRRFFVRAGALAATGAILGAAFFLGTWGFEFYAAAELERRTAMHEDALSRVMEEKPTEARLKAGLSRHGTFVLAGPETPEDVERAIATYGEAAGDQLRHKARLWPTVRVFQADGMLYFIFFDVDGVMSDFVCLPS